MKKLVSLCLVIVLALGMVQPAQAAKYKKYSNVRFGFTISYPKSFKAQAESTNGDGKSFIKKNADITAWGEIAYDFRTDKKIKTGKQIKKYLKSYGCKMKKVKVKKNSLYFETTSGQYKVFKFVKYNKKSDALIQIDVSCKNRTKYYRKMAKKIFKKLKFFRGIN